MIEIIAGTNRPGSNARRIANILLDLYRAEGGTAQILDLHDVPSDLFTPASYAAKPAAFAPIQERILAAKGLHLVVPEYNGSFPGALKYFIDMLKFPESFEHRAVAFTGEAAGMWGALRAVEQLQQIFSYRNGRQLPERVFISGIGQKLGADGKLTDDGILGRLREQAKGFISFTAG